MQAGERFGEANADYALFTFATLHIIKGQHLAVGVINGCDCAFGLPHRHSLVLLRFNLYAAIVVAYNFIPITVLAREVIYHVGIQTVGSVLAILTISSVLAVLTILAYSLVSCLNAVNHPIAVLAYGDFSAILSCRAGGRNAGVLAIYPPRAIDNLDARCHAVLAGCAILAVLTILAILAVSTILASGSARRIAGINAVDEPVAIFTDFHHRTRLSVLPSCTVKSVLAVGDIENRSVSHSDGDTIGRRRNRLDYGTVLNLRLQVGKCAFHSFNAHPKIRVVVVVTSYKRPCESQCEESEQGCT